MSTVESTTKTATTSIPRACENNGADRRRDRPLVSLVVPAYNEAAIVEKNLAHFCHYMELLESEYRWELIVVNDGRLDDTGARAEAFARTRDNVHVLHHRVNFGIGQVFKFAFTQE